MLVRVRPGAPLIAFGATALIRPSVPSSMLAASLGLAWAISLPSTMAMAACQASVSGRLEKASGYHNENLSTPKLLGFVVHEPREAHGQTEAVVVKNFHFTNTEQTFPIAFSFHRITERDCPKRASIWVFGDDTEGFRFSPKLFGPNELILGSYTIIRVSAPKF